MKMFSQLQPGLRNNNKLIVPLLPFIEVNATVPGRDGRRLLVNFRRPGRWVVVSAHHLTLESFIRLMKIVEIRRLDRNTLGLRVLLLFLSSPFALYRIGLFWGEKGAVWIYYVRKRLCPFRGLKIYRRLMLLFRGVSRGVISGVGFTPRMILYANVSAFVRVEGWSKQLSVHDSGTLLNSVPQKRGTELCGLPLVFYLITMASVLIVHLRTCMCPYSVSEVRSLPRSSPFEFFLATLHPSGVRNKNLGRISGVACSLKPGF